MAHTYINNLSAVITSRQFQQYLIANNWFLYNNSSHQHSTIDHNRVNTNVSSHVTAHLLCSLPISLTINRSNQLLHAHCISITWRIARKNQFCYIQHTPQLLANIENKLKPITVVARIIPTPQEAMYGLGITLDTL